MSSEPLDVAPIWLLLAAVTGISALAVEGGYRFGAWRHARTADEKESPVGAMVSSILALLALILAFTFGLAATRFEARRQAVLDEANAIGTTHLRARLLPEPQRGESMRLLQEYVDVRVDGLRRGRIQEVVTRSGQLHESLWAEAVGAAKARPDPITGLYIQSLNQMIDLHAVRVQAGLRSRLPFSLWMGLYSLAFLSMVAVGYQAGISGTRRSPAMLGLVLSFVGVMFLIADLDRPGEGFLTVSQQAMVDLQESMKAEKRQPL